MIPLKNSNWREIDTFGKQNLAQMIPLKNSNWRKRTAAFDIMFQVVLFLTG